MLVKIAVSSVLIASIMLQLQIAHCSEAKAKNGVEKPVVFASSKPNDLFIGPGIMFASSYVQLYPTSSPHQSFEIYARSDNFKLVQKWLINNVYANLNGERKVATAKSEYHVLLSAVNKQNMTDVLLIAPLNSEILGDDYLEKIAELKNRACPESS